MRYCAIRAIHCADWHDGPVVGNERSPWPSSRTQRRCQEPPSFVVYITKRPPGDHDGDSSWLPPPLKRCCLEPLTCMVNMESVRSSARPTYAIMSSRGDQTGRCIITPFIGQPRCCPALYINKIELRRAITVGVEHQTLVHQEKNWAIHQSPSHWSDVKIFCLSYHKQIYHCFRQPFDLTLNSGYQGTRNRLTLGQVLT